MNRRRLQLALLIAGLLAVIAPIAWAVTDTHVAFWPKWVWFGIGVVVLAYLLVRRVLRTPRGRRRWLVVDGAVLIFLTITDLATWALSGGGLFWPLFSLAPLTLIFGVHLWYVARRPDAEEEALTARVDTLTRSRRDVVDSQAAELRRIERNLHDGAQARMVSVALSIGIAERLLESDPEQALAKLNDARSAATGAVQDLRSVMNGIYPAVLADRGLGGAVRALTYDLVVPVEVEGEPPAGLAAAPEAALYFAVAELLANAVKHGEATAARVRFGSTTDDVVVEVGDDGRGGAVVGAGSGLRGISDRLAAFDGALSVDSPAGGPTRVVVRMPLAVATSASLHA